MSVVVLLSWPYAFWFLKGFRSTGPTVYMLFKILYTDILHVALIYLVLTGGYGMGFYIAFKGAHIEEFSNYTETFYTLFFAMVTGFRDTTQKGFFGHTQAPALMRFLFLCYIVMTTVLLLNLLIAMMNTTFNQVPNPNCCPRLDLFRDQKTGATKPNQTVVTTEREDPAHNRRAVARCRESVGEAELVLRPL